MHPQARTGYFLSIAASLVWAATGPGLSYLLERHNAPPLAVAFWRDAFIAVACLIGLLAFGWRNNYAMLRIGWRDLRSFALMGAISIGIYHAIFIYSIALNGVALAIVLVYLYPTFVTLGARLFFKEQSTPQQIVALVLAFAGCVLLVRAYDPALLQSSWIGALVGLASAITHAGYVLFSQRAVTRHSPWVSLALTMFFGALVLLALSMYVLGPSGLVGVSGDPTVAAWIPWLVLLALALGPTLGGYALFTMALRHIPGRVASLLVVIEVPMAALLALALLGERLTWPQFVGMLLVLLAAVLPSLKGLTLRQLRLTFWRKAEAMVERNV